MGLLHFFKDKLTEHSGSPFKLPAWSPAPEETVSYTTVILKSLLKSSPSTSTANSTKHQRKIMSLQRRSVASTQSTLRAFFRLMQSTQSTK